LSIFIIFVHFVIVFVHFSKHLPIFIAFAHFSRTFPRKISS
jgi:hypothetical protein